MKHGDQSGHQGCSASTGEGFVRKAGTIRFFLSVRRDPNLPCLSGPTSGAPNAPVFPELHGKSGSGKSGLSMAFKRIMAKAGIDAGVIRGRSGAAGRSVSALSFHSLRHSFNSALANAGVSQELRQKLTGHASADINIIYTHHELETIWSAIKTLPRLPKV